MTPAARRLAIVAGVSVVAFAAAIWLIAGESNGNEPPDLMSRGLVSAVLLAVPGLLGLIGAANGRRTVLIAAGVLCLLQSAISFSGVTLIYLVPAIIFLRAGTAGGEPATRERIRPLRIVVAAVIAVPIALVAIMTTGILGVLVFALVAGLASSWRRGAAGQSLGRSAAARGVAILLLVIGGWIASFTLTETACWVVHEGPSGGVTYERVPPTNTFSSGPGVIGGGCAGGTITPAGAALAGGLVLLALGVAAFPGGRPRRIGGGERAGTELAGS